MKKKVLIISMVILWGAIGGWFYFQFQKKFTIENIIPKEALIYVNQKDLAQLIKDFKNSQFGKDMAMINVPALLEKSGVAKEQIELFTKFQAVLGILIESPLFQRVFGQEVAVTIYPADFFTYDISALWEIAKQIMVVIRLDKETEIAEFLSRLFSQIGQQIIITKAKYQNQTIVNITMPQLAALNVKISYTKIGPYLVLGLGEDSARRCINVVKRGKPSLSQDKNYRLTKSRFVEGARTTAFVNIDMLLTTLKDRLLEMTKAYESESGQDRPLDEVLKDLSGFLSFGYSAVYSPLIQSRINFFFVKEQMTSDVQKFYSCELKLNKNIKFIPKDIILYHWSNCYDMPAYWSRLKEEMNRFSKERQGGPSPQQVIEGVEKLLQLSIDTDILPLMGREQGWVLSDITLGGIFPIPKFLFFMSVTDRAKAQGMIETLADQPVLFVQSEDYKGIKINYITIPLSSDVQPAYCFIEDYFLLTSHRQLFHEVIDVYQNQKPSLASDSIFLQLNMDLTQMTNGLFLLRGKEFINKLRGVVAWGGEWLITKFKELEAYKAGSQKRLSDLAEEMRMFEEDIQNLKNQLQGFEEEKKQLISQGADVVGVDEKIKEVRESLSLKERSRALSEDKREELKGIIEGLDKEKAIEPEPVTLYLNGFVYPSLKAFESLRAVGNKIDISNNYFESTMFLKFGE